MRSIKIYIKLNVKIYMLECISILTNGQRHRNIIYWKMYDAFAALSVVARIDAVN